MNDEQLHEEPDVTSDAQPHTKDVREAIERAKETLVPDPETGETFVLPDVQTEPAQARAEIAQVEEMPSVNLEPQVQESVSIPSDHPMAPLYVQQPMPPNLKANRLAGVLISLLAAIAYGVVYAGAIAATRAPYYAPSKFLQEGLYPYLTSLGFVLPIVAFFVGMMILVLIFNRAGWWVYAVLGVVVAIMVWIAAGAGYALSPQLFDKVALLGESGKRFDLHQLLAFSLTLPAVLAAFIAREVTVWFGAWIGHRGNKVKQRNAQALQEHEEKVAEVQARIS